MPAGRLLRDRWHYFLAYEGVNQDSQPEATQIMPAARASFSPATREFLSANAIPLTIFGNGGLVRQVRPEYFDGHNVRRQARWVTTTGADAHHEVQVPPQLQHLWPGRHPLRLQR